MSHFIKSLFWQTKGDIMKKIYSPDELYRIDTATPIDTWEEYPPAKHCMNYNGSTFGRLENLEEMAKERGVDIRPLGVRKAAFLEENYDMDDDTNMFRYSSIVPGVCIHEDCDQVADVEPDQIEGWCENCKTNSIVAYNVLKY